MAHSENRHILKIASCAFVRTNVKKQVVLLCTHEKQVVLLYIHITRHHPTGMSGEGSQLPRMRIHFWMMIS